MVNSRPIAKITPAKPAAAAKESSSSEDSSDNDTPATKSKPKSRAYNAVPPPSVVKQGSPSLANKKLDGTGTSAAAVPKSPAQIVNLIPALMRNQLQK
ncbi:nucleolar protein dao-5-like [Protopterus annectens]|uniref:nucleolar protein dao-5-like n=1 Tax=Protopterus annectens TaxID=7888 RepID=UPI001CF9FF84|nr:nucleolar protein dao-5-like [Protopterus annectens]